MSATDAGGPDRAAAAAGAGGGEVSHYSFGTSERAAERLLLVAEVFEPTLVGLLRELPVRRWSFVVDLGCGPGSSTAQLLRHLDGRHEAGRVVGLDSSPAFVQVAAQRVPEATFMVADVTEPLPLAAPDLVYARFLLSHLPDPLTVVDGWVGQLAEDGFLALEEPERIDSVDPAFLAYLELVEGVVASRGATMLVGPTLGSLEHDGVVLNRTVVHPVDSAHAATMFGLNLESLRADPWVRADYATAQVDEIADRLEALRAASAAASPITWRIRQVMISRR